MTEKRKAILKSMRNVLKDWDESAHPRDENGRFAGGGGSTSGGANHQQRPEFENRAGN